VEELFFEGNGTLTIIQGEKEEVLLRGDEKEVTETAVFVERHVLKIIQKKSWLDYIRKPKSSSLQSVVTVKDLSALILKENPLVKIDRFQAHDLKVVLVDKGHLDMTLDATHLETKILRSGEVFVKGQVASQNVFLKGSGIYRARDLQSASCTVTIAKSGVAYVRASDLLDASVHGYGVVNYSGNPQRVLSDVSGAGQLIQE
jgi:hypothetical protein